MDGLMLLMQRYVCLESFYVGVTGHDINVLVHVVFSNLIGLIKITTIQIRESNKSGFGFE